MASMVFDVAVPWNKFLPPREAYRNAVSASLPFVAGGIPSSRSNVEASRKTNKRVPAELSPLDDANATDWNKCHGDLFLVE